MSEAPQEFAKQCTSCARADRGCVSFPSPVGECLQYVHQSEAGPWWREVHPDREQINGD